MLNEYALFVSGGSQYPVHAPFESCQILIFFGGDVDVKCSLPNITNTR
jgi:hypothetical protein